MTDIKLTFIDERARRKCAGLLRQFTGKKAFVRLSGVEEFRELFGERGLRMQYRDDHHRPHFPTKEGWEAFLEFARLLHGAEPLKSRATEQDTAQACNRAFANLLSGRLLPTSIEDVIDNFSDDFKHSLTGRVERVFSKVRGITVTEDCFVSVADCWLGGYGQLCFEAIQETDTCFKDQAIETISEVFQVDSAFIVGNRNPGTSDRVEEDSAYQCELALSLLCLMLNTTYVRPFSGLWRIQRVDRPEVGIDAHASFSIIENADSESRGKLAIKRVFAQQPFKIDRNLVDIWHERLRLGAINRLVSSSSLHDVELVHCLIGAILYFRRAANQPTPEMQVTILWICVESFFTGSGDEVVRENVRGLLAMTTASMNPDYWPNGAKTPEELRSVFKDFYDYRSRTVHDGRRGHVSIGQVQEFSLVVCNLVIAVADLVERGMRTTQELADASRDYVDRLAL